MTPDAVFALIGTALLAVLSWIALMLFGLRERVSVLATQSSAEAKARAEATEQAVAQIADLRKAKHDHANILMRHSGRLLRLEEHCEIGPPNSVKELD